MQSAKCDIPILDHNEQNYPFSVKKTVTSTFQHPESVAQFNALGAYPSTTAAMLGECVPFLYGPTFLPSSEGRCPLARESHRMTTGITVQYSLILCFVIMFYCNETLRSVWSYNSIILLLVLTEIYGHVQQ